jgi:hypothetical protein
MRMRIALSAALASLFLTSAAPLVQAYQGQPVFQLFVGGPGGTVRCDQPVAITATVIDVKTGAPVRLQNVTWSLAAVSPGDHLSASVTTTNASGQTSVVLSFGPAAGARTVTARATISSASTTVACSGGLPATSANLPAGQPAGDTSGGLAAGGLGLALLAWVGWVWRSKRTTPG